MAVQLAEKHQRNQLANCWGEMQRSLAGMGNMLGSPRLQGSHRQWHEHRDSRKRKNGLNPAFVTVKTSWGRFQPGPASPSSAGLLVCCCH